MTAIISRSINLSTQLMRKSMFLFGPRSVGKTFMIHKQLPSNTLVIDLLKSQFFLPLSQNPAEIRALIKASDASIVVVDEIQKLPILLDEIHQLIESTTTRFLLTGSSARKLKRENANMLGGRAGRIFLYPLTWHELSEAKLFDIERYIQFGSIPRVWLSKNPQEELFDYVDVYLKEEILAEAAVRNLPAFSRFLKVAALNSGEVLNYTALSSDIGVSANTIREHFAILDDTLLGFQLPPWRSAKNRKSIAKAKHYLFDCGILNTLAGTKNVDRNSNIYGICFEHFILNEIRAYGTYQQTHWELSFWRTDHGDEVDIIINDNIAIEVKSTTSVTTKMRRGLNLIKSESNWLARIIVSHDPLTREIDGILHLHWEEFLRRLWSGSFDG